MNATAVIQTLLKLGVQVKDAWTKSNQNWVTFLDSSAFKDIQGTVGGLIQSLQGPSLQNTITAVQQKESDLLNGRAIPALSVDELTQYHALSDVEHQLVTKLLTTSDPRSFLSVLVTDVLPVLVQGAKIVIPLLT